MYWIDDIQFMAQSDVAAFTLIDDMENISDWNPNTGAATLSLEATEVKRGAGSLRIATTNNDDGIHDYRMVTKTGSWDVSGYNTATFWFKTSVDLPTYAFNFRITDSDGTVSDGSLRLVFPLQETLKAGQWYQARWNFKADPGWVTGGDSDVDYSDIVEVMVYTDDELLPAAGCADAAGEQR